MLHKTTINSSTLELLIKLMEDEFLNNFVLVGGTALALQLGHRISLDIDLFTSEPFNESELADHLRTNFEDINFNEPVKMAGGSELNWMKIEKRLKSMQKRPDRIFKVLN